MIRLLAKQFGAGLFLLAAQICGAEESFPVVHNEPITIRVLSGRDGHPLAQVRMTLAAGYNQRDIDLRLRQEEALTDKHGNARLPNALANFPLLVVSVAKQHLCQADRHGAAFSVERIRRDGLSAPNGCGTATVEDAPGMFTVWVKAGKAAADPAPTVTGGLQAAALAAGSVSTPAAALAPSTPVCPAATAPATPPAMAPARNRRKQLPPLAPA
jgi:hypothetical protein